VLCLVRLHGAESVTLILLGFGCTPMPDDAEGCSVLEGVFPVLPAVDRVQEGKDLGGGAHAIHYKLTVAQRIHRGCIVI
jgi:hypothetical protein